MITIKTDEDLKPYWQANKKRYFFDDSVLFEPHIETVGSIVVKGDIRANGEIFIVGNIETKGDIITDGCIDVSGNIKAGWHIRANGYIVANEITTKGYILPLAFRLSAQKVSTKGLPFWPDFWTDTPPFRPWKKLIEGCELYYERFSNVLPIDERKKICAWEGWHWILRGQLECYFGLRDSFEPPKTLTKQGD